MVAEEGLSALASWLQRGGTNHHANRVTLPHLP
jgi:hypothetical protein